MEVGQEHWDIDIICDLLYMCVCVYICESILKIPLSRLCTHDKKICCDSPTHSFFIKFAYVIAKSLLGKPYVDKDLRRGVRHLRWTSTVSPWVKFFVRRVILNLVPTAPNLLMNDVN